ncbi:MAG TPA: ATP-binding protein [Terriglobia bacterium]|nr:ATP-binding protein [Terriglobia bacterium]
MTGESALIPADPNHDVQFYESEPYLHEAVARFLADGLRHGDQLVVITTPEHRHAFINVLNAQGFDIKAAIAAGQLTILDARETLATFMVGNLPDEQLFNRSIGDVITKARGGREQAKVRAFGEMVDILWREGNAGEALLLEDLWNALARTHSFSLLCAYSMSNFGSSEHSVQFQQVCRQHTHVRPTERYMKMGDEPGRFREISQLQQRARSLENEIERRKALEQTLRAARDEAEAASRVKDEFLAVLSHELRTPLNAILGWIQIVNSRSDEQTVNRALEVIKRNARLQVNLINDLLDVSRVMTGKMTINSGLVDLVRLIEASADSIRPAASAKSIQLDLQFDESAFFINGDSDRLQQVLWNLLTNAVKFTPSNGRVEIRLEHDDANVRIHVRDNGQGIAPEFLPHVFDRFRQADTGTTRKHGGLGLGLAVVRYLVEAHGGRVRAESKGVGFGTTFTVQLPVSIPVSGSVEDKKSRLPIRPLDGFHILIVDDERDTRELFRFILEESGAVVETAASSDAALFLLESSRFDMLVADIGLPAHDGFALIAAIRAHAQPHVREIGAIAVTSYAGDDYKTHALAAGFDDYIAKPIPPRQLAQLVSDRLGGRVA